MMGKRKDTKTTIVHLHMVRREDERRWGPGWDLWWNTKNRGIYCYIFISCKPLNYTGNNSTEKCTSKDNKSDKKSQGNQQKYACINECHGEGEGGIEGETEEMREGEWKRRLREGGTEGERERDRKDKEGRTRGRRERGRRRKEEGDEEVEGGRGIMHIVGAHCFVHCSHQGRGKSHGRRRCKIMATMWWLSLET